MKRPALLLLSLLLLAVAGCKPDRRPADVIEPDAMASFLADLYLVEGYFAVQSEYRFDAASPEVVGAIDGILEKHHLMREAVERSLDYYSQHPDQYGPIQQQAQQLIEQRTGIPPIGTGSSSHRHSL